jgi:hypothetical protein
MEVRDMADHTPPFAAACAAPRATRGRRRRITLAISATLLASTAALGQLGLGALPVAARDNCQNVGQGNGSNGTAWYCGWTGYGPYVQWPTNTGGGAPTDPFCGAYCLNWPMPGNSAENVPAHITLSNQQNGPAYYNDAYAAMKDWGGQPYNSPWMYECNCSTAAVNVGWGSYNAQYCGMSAITQWDSYNRVIGNPGAYINLNNANQYTDGPPPNNGCNAQSALYHEWGHVFTLGHSSDPHDVMYWAGGNVTSVTDQAQTGLNNMYGPYQNNQQSGGCNNCQGVPCPESVAGTQTYTWATCGNGVPLPSVDGYYAKAWAMSQGVSVPSPVSEISSADSCFAYFLARQYLPWVQCETK